MGPVVQITQITKPQPLKAEFIFFPDPYYIFEDMFPDYKEEFCYSPYVQRHLWEYNCLTLDLNIITDPEDRCRYDSLDLMTEGFFLFVCMSYQRHYK